MSAPAERVYRFVQFEFAWPVGPADGRYLMRTHAGEEPHHVLIVATHASTRRPPRRRWGRGAPPAPAEPVETPVSRATLVDAQATAQGEAEAWLEQAAGDATSQTVESAARLLNAALRAHRAAAADPYARDAAATQALIIRAGYGAGFEVADGHWSDARELSPVDRQTASRRERRQAALRPQERLAALLSGRDAVLACEEMALRARADLDAERPREAALQTHLALEAAVVELQAWRSQRELGQRLDALDGDRERLAAAANEALQGGPSAETVAAVRETLERIEAALRARVANAEF